MNEKLEMEILNASTDGQSSLNVGLGWEPIASVPKDGTIVWLKCEHKPEYGNHLMEWSKRRKRWEGTVFAPCRRIKTWWDEDVEQPTHWKRTAPNVKLTGSPLTESENSNDI